MGINKAQKTDDEKIFLEQIGLELGNARRNKHMTQKRVAEIIGCSLSHINDVENGNANITVYELVSLCKLYNISPIHIIGPNYFQYQGLELLPKDEQQLIKTLYKKLLYSHKKDFRQIER